MKPSIILLSIFSLALFSFKPQSNNKEEIPIEIQLVFKSGNSRLTNKHKKKLDKVILEIENGKEVWIYPVAKFTSKSSRSKATNGWSSRNSLKYCFDINSKEQANSILEYLLTRDYGTIFIETDFLYPIEGPSVRLKLSKGIYKNKKKENIIAQPKAIGEQILLKDYFPEKRSQFFIIDPKKDTLIEGEEGTRLFFASGSLLSDDSVQIELKEFYKASDFLKSDLQTVSNGKMLFTGGTIYLDARKKSNLNEQVKINPSRGINAEFTEGKNYPEMELFLKDKNSKETNWIRDRKRSWRYTRNYMLNKIEKYKTFVFNSPDEYQEFVTSGEAKKVEKIWMGVLKDIAIAKFEAERKVEQAKQDSLRKIEQASREAELAVWRAEREQTRKNEKAINRLIINDLGFINSDVFVDTITKEYSIMADNSVNATYYLVFEGRNKGILKGSGKEKIIFGNIPINAPFSVIGVFITKNEKHIFKKKLNSMNEDIGQVVLAKTDENELNRILDSINS